MPVGQTIGLLVIPLLLGLVFFNGVVMLVSPARWFTLPRYMAFRGALHQSDYTATRAGRFQIRILGLILAGATAWMIASFFGITYGSQTSDAGPVGVPVDWWLCVATCIGAIGCGIAMLLKPRWWIAKYFRGGGGAEENQIGLERALRIMSLPFIGIGVYFLLQCVAIR